MGEIMIDWNTSNVKPQVNTADDFDARHHQSARVLVRIKDSNGKFCGCSFGRYWHDSNTWVIEGFLGEFIITHWSSLNEPSTACFEPNKE
jgi:hypothetical protein